MWILLIVTMLIALVCFAAGMAVGYKREAVKSQAKIQNLHKIRIDLEERLEFREDVFEELRTKNLKLNEQVRQMSARG